MSEFISQLDADTKSGELNSSHKSDIVAISRISKLGTERIHLWSLGVFLEVRVRHGHTFPAENRVPFMPKSIDTVGSPSLRDVYKICLYVMQIILKLKSASSIYSFSSFKWDYKSME